MQLVGTQDCISVIEYLPNMHKALNLIISTVLNWAKLLCTPVIPALKVESGGSGVQGRPQLQRKMKDSLSHVRQK